MIPEAHLQRAARALAARGPAAKLWAARAREATHRREVFLRPVARAEMADL